MIDSTSMYANSLKAREKLNREKNFTKLISFLAGNIKFYVVRERENKRNILTLRKIYAQTPQEKNTF